jgi:hypothetical protein
MPAGVKRAEIDIRSGKVLKELDPAASLNIKDQENALNRKPDDGPVNADDEPQSPEADIYEKDVPAEFRRIELFITGTIPNKSLADDQPTDENVQEIPPVEGEVPSPSPTGTPIDGTWQDDAEPPTNVGSNRKPPQHERERTVSVMVCPLTGMRATANCPTKELRTYPAGSEPKEFCTFHVRPPK